MKVLIIGGGGREYTLAWKIAEDERVSQIYAAPGNGGLAKIAKNIDIPAEDIGDLADFAEKEAIDLTIVGPEIPLSLGIADEFKSRGLRIFGVDKNCAQLEASKEYSKSFMERHNIPTAKYKSYTDSEEAKKALKDFNYPLVIKADGLCYGKGVIICEDEAMAVETIEEILEEKIFGEEGSKIVIEEFLDGIEASLLCLVSGNKIFPLEPAEDYKQIFDNDQGPNTGGVGCYSPSNLFNDQLRKEIDEKVLRRIEAGFEKDGMDFNGVLFIGLMVVDGRPNVLEFNVRFGDPETQVVIPRLESKLIDLLEKTIDSSLKEEDIRWTDKPCMTVILTSGGYPGEYESGFEIRGLDDLDDDIKVFHNGTIYENGKYYTAGGRVLSVTTMADTIEEARERIYSNIDRIQYEGMYYRKDIGKNINY